MQFFEKKITLNVICLKNSVLFVPSLCCSRPRVVGLSAGLKSSSNLSCDHSLLWKTRSPSFVRRQYFYPFFVQIVQIPVQSSSMRGAALVMSRGFVHKSFLFRSVPKIQYQKIPSMVTSAKM